MEENISLGGGKADKAGKGKTGITRRRALGDISNVAGDGRPAGKMGKAVCEKEEHKGMIVDSVEIMAPAPIELAPFDEADKDDPLCAVEYVGDIYEHFFKTESDRLAPPNYMNKQPDLNPKMRAILIDWLSEVNDKYRLRSETLYLAINLIDRYLSEREVHRKKLQLVGVTGLLLAAKYVEIYPPQVEELVRVSGKAYKRDEILSMEQRMLGALGFRLTVPTPYMFLIRFLKAAGADAETAYRARYFLERSTLEYRMLKYIPSVMAGSAVYMALLCRGETRDHWSREMAKHTKCDEATLRPCVAEMAEIIRNAPTEAQQGVRRKYCAPRFLHVGHAELPDSL